MVSFFLFFSAFSSNSIYCLEKFLKPFLGCKSFASLPTKCRLHVVIKSPHNFNKSREHFETKISKKVIKITVPNFKSNLFINYITGLSWSFFGISLDKRQCIKNTLFF